MRHGGRINAKRSGRIKKISLLFPHPSLWTRLVKRFFLQSPWDPSALLDFTVEGSDCQSLCAQYKESVAKCIS